MALDTFEIRDGEIDAEEIMQKIRENMRKRKEAGIYPERDIEEVRDALAMDKAASTSSGGRKDLDYITYNWDIENKGYLISSHRRATGKLLVKGRQLVHGEVRRYVDPIVSKQKEFNASSVRLLTHISQKVDEISERIADIEESLHGEVESEIGRVESEIGRVESEIGRVESSIESVVRREANAILSSMNQDIENKAWLASIIEGRLHDYEKVSLSSDGHSDYKRTNYFLFEEAFRGSREEIKKRQAAFIQFFDRCDAVLDIGCGRGEFLENLKERGIGSKGIDIDDDMVSYCRSKGVDVEKVDAVAYLEGVEDKSLDGIFIDQVVEHLEPDYLVKLIGLCYQKLKYGYYIVVETVNPLSFASFANFYIDPTHIRPVHPQTLRFFLGSVGFRELETRFFSPIPEEARLKKQEFRWDIEEREKEFLEIYNRNVDMINNALYGAQDFAVIGKK